MATPNIIPFLFLLVAFANAKTHEYFDLCYSINNDTIYYPGQKVEFQLSKDQKGYTAAGYWYATYSFCMGEHGGTHVDAPLHFSPTGWTLDEIPPSHLIDVQATVVDVEKHVFALEHPDNFTLTVENLIEHESVHGTIPFKGVVLIHTGWGRYWPNKVKYLGWKNDTDVSQDGRESSPVKPILSFPGLSAYAAKWLVNERGIVGLGIDTPSVDVGDNKGNLPVHIFLADRQIYNIENLANLHLVLKAVNKGVNSEVCKLHLFVLPIKITGGTGGPARILAYCK